MLSPEDISQDILEPTTDEFERFPRSFDHRSALSERRQSILQQKSNGKYTTDILSPLAPEQQSTRVALRQLAQLRKENQHLRSELEDREGAYERLVSEYKQLKARFESEVAVVHSGYQQEVERYQSHLRELMEERSVLEQQYNQLEQRYQDLYHSFEDTVDASVRQKVELAAKSLDLSTGKVPAELEPLTKTIELQIKQDIDKLLVDTFQTKRELLNMIGVLENERHQTEVERQELYTQLESIREQSVYRYQTAQARLRARWKVSTVFTILFVLAALVFFQFVFLGLFHAISPIASFAILGPIIFVALLSILLANPIVAIKQIYTSAPHKKKVR